MTATTDLYGMGICRSIHFSRVGMESILEGLGALARSKAWRHVVVYRLSGDPYLGNF